MRVQQLVRKRVAVIAVAGIIGFAATACALPNVSNSGPSDPYTAGLYSAVNRDRGANRLGGLAWSPKLANQASGWARQMAAANSLYHQDLGALISSPNYAGFYTLGENILVGSGSMSPDQMEATWMNSGPHRANILSGAFDIVGIGYYRGPDGRIWAVQDFGGI
jgi:uncharacterized protein YkwD